MPPARAVNGGGPATAAAIDAPPIPPPDEAEEEAGAAFPSPDVLTSSAPPMASREWFNWGAPFNRALDTFHRGEHEAALREFDQLAAAAKDPVMMSRARLMAGRALLELERPREALARFEACDIREYHLADVCGWSRVHAGFLLRDWAAALDAADRFLRERPRSRFFRRTQFKRADILYASGRLHEALESYTRLIKRHPASEFSDAARFTVADILLELGRQEEASRAFWTLWTDYPTSVYAPRAANRLRELRDAPVKPGAKERLRRAIRFEAARWRKSAYLEYTSLIDRLKSGSDEYENVQLKRAKYLFAEKENDSALGLFNHLAESSKRDDIRADALLHVARIRARTGPAEDTAAAYLEIVRQFPKSPIAGRALYMAGWTWYDSGEYRRAIPYYERLVKEYPRYEEMDEALWQLGWNHWLLGAWNKAEGAFRKLASGYPGTESGARGRYFLARALMKQNRREAAIFELRRLPLDAAASYYSVLAVGQLNALNTPASLMADAMRPDYDQMRDGLREALTANLDPAGLESVFGDPESLAAFRRAAELLGLGFYDDAVEELHAVRRDRNSNPRLIVALARMQALAGDFHGMFQIARMRFAGELERELHPGNLDVFRLAWPEAFPAEVKKHAGEYGVDTSLVLAIMREESTFRPRVRSPVNAIGLMQIMPYTGRRIAALLRAGDYETGQLAMPQVSIRFGAWYLSQLLYKYHGNPVLAAAAYNAGPRAADRWLSRHGHMDMDEFVEMIGYLETRNYVKRVIRSMAMYQVLYSGSSTLTAAPLSRPPAPPRSNINW
ncbi:MAG: Outer membrane protein assembly factor BamD [Myxococcota bacterium]|nr:Outer membrane protein assembly factor BamD [Myxococcota bacterium]